MSCYFFVMSSLNHPIYRLIQKKRKGLFEKYEIPYTVVMNAPMKAVNSTYPPLMEDEVLYPMGGYNPSMTLKFLFAVKLYFRSFSHWEDIPDYIVRLNATVYVHFPSLFKYLETLPREKVLAGPVIRHLNKHFVNGMVMVFSKDVLRDILSGHSLYEQKLLEDYDDVVLSLLAKPLCGDYIDLMPHFVYGTSSLNANAEGVYDLDRIQPLETEKWMFRIRHDGSHRKADVENWDLLMTFFDEIPESSELFGEGAFSLASAYQNNYSLWIWVFLCFIGILVMILVWWLWRRKRNQRL